MSCCRQALFGDHVRKPQSLEDSDLSRLYTATSLMQIDDNVMRCVRSRGQGPGGRLQASAAQYKGFALLTAVFRVFFFFPLNKCPVFKNRKFLRKMQVLDPLGK